MPKAKSARKLGHIIVDRDARSRSVKAKAMVEPVKPDVEVNCRQAIMGDEGPVAATNPHNQADQPTGDKPVTLRKAA